MNAKHLFFVVATLLGFTACSEGIIETPASPDDQPKVHTVRLDMTGEINVSQEPLSRVALDGNDLIGIQVNYKPVSSSTSSSYKPYAYGLFDTLDSITIDLLEEYLYQFEVLLIIDGKDVIYEDVITIDEVDYVGYGWPYQHEISSVYNEHVVTPITNAFMYSNKNCFEHISIANYYGYQLKGDTAQIQHPENVDVYYGYTIHTPTSNFDFVPIFLKRMVYGIKIIAGDFLTDGVITVSIDSPNDSSYEKYIQLTSETKEVVKQYAYNTSVGSASTGKNDKWYSAQELEDAYMTLRIDFSWKRDNGDIVSWKSQNYTVNRLKQTIINLEYYTNGDVTNGFNVSFEDWEIEDGLSYIHGDEQADYDF